MLLVDSSGIFDDALCCSMWAGLGIPGDQVPTTGDNPSHLANDVTLPADAAVEVRSVPVSAQAGHVLTYLDSGGLTGTATAPGTYEFVYALYADGVFINNVTSSVTYGPAAAQLSASGGGSSGGSATLGGGAASLSASGGGSSGGSASLSVGNGLSASGGGTSGGSANLATITVGTLSGIAINGRFVARTNDIAV